MAHTGPTLHPVYPRALPHAGSSAPCNDGAMAAAHASSSPRRTHPAVLVPWAGAVIVVLISAAIAHRHPGATPWGASTASELIGLVAGAGVIAAGCWLRWRRPGRGGVLLALAGVAWSLGEWNNPGVGSSAVFTIGMTTSATLASALVAHAALGYPSGRLAAPRERVAIALAYADALLVGFAVALFLDPRRLGCSLCPSNLLLIHGSARVAADLQHVGLWVGALWPVLFAVVAVWSLALNGVPSRRLRWIVVVSGMVYVALAWLETLHDLWPGETVAGTFDHRIWQFQAVAMLGITVGVFRSGLIQRRSRSAMARLVLDLGAVPPPGALREALARWLGDPDLDIVYRVGVGSDRWVDAAGAAADVSMAGRQITPIERRGEVVGLLVHREGVPDPLLVDGLSAAALLAFENERLHAELLVRLGDLRASRARIVTTADRERRRLERDLHGGAQQGLVGSSMAIAMARSRIGDADPGLASLMDEAGRRVNDAIGSLRELAHGIFPAILADEGLGAAAQVLAERASVPLSIAGVPDRRCPPAVESAGYLVVGRGVEALAGADPDADLSAWIHHDAERLVVQVTDRHPRQGPSPSVDLTEIADRVGALEGTVRFGCDEDGSMKIEAEIPCGS